MKRIGSQIKPDSVQTKIEAIVDVNTSKAKRAEFVSLGGHA